MSQPQEASNLTEHTMGKKHLPQPRGPHSVGFVDLLTSGDTGVLVRIYYPTKEKCLEQHDKWPVWAEDSYLSGLLHFTKAMAHRWPSWAPRGEFEHFDSMRLLSKWVPNTGFPALFKHVNGKVYTPIIAKAEMNTDQKWPLIIFSHGLGCGRFTYSQICYDLASYGFVVVAPEHREGSACHSYQVDKNGKQWPIPHRRIEWTEEEYFVRNRQVRERCFEVCNALKLALKLNEEPENVKYFIDTSNPNSDVGDLKMFKDSMDVTNPAMVGHSFGGATTLMALGAEEKFKLGIVLDGWLFPLRDNEKLVEKVTQPVMFVNMDGFLNKDNLQKMQTFSTAKTERICYYIKGSVHQNIIDVPFIIRGSHMKRVVGVASETCPNKVMTLNNRLMVQFIRKHINLEPNSEIEDYIENEKDLLVEGFGTNHCVLKEPGRP